LCGKNVVSDNVPACIPDVDCPEELPADWYWYQPNAEEYDFTKLIEICNKLEEIPK
jgi:hypothetical protein